ncbi:unnamed protein product [Discosporangium mesarthrocarpum]
MAGGGSKWHPLHAALVLGHEEKVKKVFLDGGEDPKMLELRNGSGWGALHFASQSGSPKLVEWLLGLGCNSGSCTAKGETALHLAAARGDERICNLLLEGGAPAGVTTREGRTALHAAAEQGHLAVAKLLVSKGGISPATTDANRMSAAALAKTNKHKAMVAFFLRSCPSAHTTLKPGVACGGGVGGLWQGGKAGSLVRGLSALRKEEVGGTRRKRGLGQGDSPGRLHLLHGPAAERSSRAGNWHGAAGHNGLPSPSDMHGSGAAPGAGRGGGYDFLKAARDGDTAALGRILHCGEVGVDWVGGSNGWTAVMEAAAHGCREAVCYLVDRGADLEQANKKGMTPLQLAVRSGHLAVVEELLARGANPGGVLRPCKP